MAAPQVKPLLLASLALLFLVTLSLVAGASTAGASGTRVLGSAHPAQASCPEDCLVEARVSGFQTSIGRLRKPFVAPARGRIVAWSIKLGSPKRRDLKAFNRKFGEPKARISILKPVRRRGVRRYRKRFRLLRQSPVVRLRPLFGRETSFTLARPLKIGRGHVVALTIPTWAPAFSVNQSQRTRWLASRAPSRRRGGCLTGRGFANLAAGAPHQKLGLPRTFGCSYRGARLLYTATFVKRGTTAR
jgi:hypothetical protein